MQASFDAHWQVEPSCCSQGIAAVFIPCAVVTRVAGCATVINKSLGHTLGPIKRRLR